MPKIKLIQTKDYLLLIDEEAEINVGDKNIIALCQDFDEPYILTLDNVEEEDIEHCDCKIIAYYPLAKDAKELDLTLLPNPFKDELKELINKFNANYNRRGEYYLGLVDGAKLGYKAAQSKQFSLEDMKKAIEMARVGFKEYPNNSFKAISNYIKDETNRIIQSLSTQQLPKEFIPEYNRVFFTNTFSSEGLITQEGIRDIYFESLKITTNSEGKQELVGTYQY